MNMISERATTCIFMNAIPQLNQRVAPMSDCLSVWSCRTFVRDQNESDRTAPTACYWCPGCLVLQQHKNKIWIPHKIMVNRTTCRQLSPNIWENWIIIMLINGYKENTLSMVTYKLFKFFFFFINLCTLHLQTSVCYVWRTGPQDLLHELWGHILGGKNSFHPLQCICSTWYFYLGRALVCNLNQ